jgi:hypothetical protein
MKRDSQFQFRVVFVIAACCLAVSGLIPGVLTGSWVGWATFGLGVAIAAWALTATQIWRFGPAHGSPAAESRPGGVKQSFDSPTPGGPDNA